MFDLHLHTCYSEDGHEKPETMAKVLKRKGFAGMAITDHNTVEGALKKYHFNEFIVIPGIEVSTDRGHILGIGVQDRITKKRAEDVIDEIHDNGGVAIFAHPYRIFSGAIKNFEGLKFDGIETFNARSFPSQNKRAAKLAAGMGGATTGGSDAHYSWEAGRGYTVMEAESVDEVVEKILKKETKSGGQPSIAMPLKSAMMALYAYALRGFIRV